ncbi:MAG: hypothetical protein S0880_07355 [Actinomycetota bacterium]|nr:hypothetical protein [Actinomycetota bacterium]
MPKVIKHNSGRSAYLLDRAEIDGLYTLSAAIHGSMPEGIDRRRLVKTLGASDPLRARAFVDLHLLRRARDAELRTFIGAAGITDPAAVAELEQVAVAFTVDADESVRGPLTGREVRAGYVASLVVGQHAGRRALRTAARVAAGGTRTGAQQRNRDRWIAFGLFGEQRRKRRSTLEAIASAAGLPAAVVDGWIEAAPAAIAPEDGAR